MMNVKDNFMQSQNKLLQIDPVLEFRVLETTYRHKIIQIRRDIVYKMLICHITIILRI